MMQPFTLQDAAQMTGVALDASVRPEQGYTGVSTDTRAIRAGDVFVALRGDRFDGHQYVQQAFDAGAVAVVVDERQSGVAGPQLVVDDTVNALGRLALGNRLLSKARCVAVTGSSGKTTVKEMLAAILRQQGNALATEGNLNNHIGVPLTLFRLAPENQYAVIELGASGLGEIAHTVSLARPDVGIITNAGEAHLEGFGSYDNIVVAKGEIIDGVAADGAVVLNADDPACPIWVTRAGARRVVTVSEDPSRNADYHYRNIRTSDGITEFDLIGRDGWELAIKLNLPGAHNCLNASLAIAATRHFGMTDQLIQDGLAALQPVKGRLQQIALKSGVNVIDDSYNANPTSMKAALRLLAGTKGARVAVLGRMAELGADESRLHEEVGELAAELGIDYLLTVGDGTAPYLKGYGAQGLHFENHEQAADWLLASGIAPMTILTKGSRSSAMDNVVRVLLEKVNN
ncbi:UDP-N-acetylmuramoyl-tripeptide--D-alanyl-D-alanine ligase [Marinobacter sp. 1Y8]